MAHKKCLPIHSTAIRFEFVRSFCQNHDFFAPAGFADQLFGQRWLLSAQQPRRRSPCSEQRPQALQHSTSSARQVRTSREISCTDRASSMAGCGFADGIRSIWCRSVCVIIVRYEQSYAATFPTRQHSHHRSGLLVSQFCSVRFPCSALLI